MKVTLTKTTFIEEMHAYRPENFSYQGLERLFEHLEELEENTHTEIEFDPVAIACEYSEMPITDAEEYWRMDIDEIRENTSVIDVDDETVIILEF